MEKALGDCLGSPAHRRARATGSRSTVCPTARLTVCQRKAPFGALVLRTCARAWVEDACGGFSAGGQAGVPEAAGNRLWFVQAARLTVHHQGALGAPLLRTCEKVCRSILLVLDRSVASLGVHVPHEISRPPVNARVLQKIFSPRQVSLSDQILFFLVGVHVLDKLCCFWCRLK